MGAHGRDGSLEQDRARCVELIETLLLEQGIRGETIEAAQMWRLDHLTTGDGRPLMPNVRDFLQGQLEILAFTLERIEKAARRASDGR